MCGIVGYVGKKGNCIEVLLNGLRRLEYRGYDSCGIAYLKNEKVIVQKEKGKIDNLYKKIDSSILSDMGIAHTRWATHGVSNIDNAHPHKVGGITLVHNGIIENYIEIKKNLENVGYRFISETDTEVLTALIDYLYSNNESMLNTLNSLNNYLVGSYALGIICDDDRNNLYVIRKNSPLIIGVGDTSNYIASDVPAILSYTQKYIALEDDDYAKISASRIEVYNNGIEKEKKEEEFLFDLSSIDKCGYQYYMEKEIYEQPEVFKKTTEKYLECGVDSLMDRMLSFSNYKKIRIIACGSATHAGLVGKQMLEKYANIKTEVETASEFRYNKLFLDKNELVIVISQSGETADTLEALKISNKNGNDTLGIINEKGSTIARCFKIVLYTEAGKEIAVATTKAYSAQITMLSLIALNIAINNKAISNEELSEILKSVRDLPAYMESLLQNKKLYEEIAKILSPHKDIFVIGRGVDYALSEEGSLKIKEISYKHSEAYPSGELKHGTISLIEEGTPVIAIATDKKIISKTISNIKEVKSRGAFVIYITNEDNIDESFYDIKIKIPKVVDLFSPLLTVIPLQLIAYSLAKLEGCDIDKPKNLAKSVTVE